MQVEQVQVAALAGCLIPAADQLNPVEGVGAEVRGAGGDGVSQATHLTALSGLPTKHVEQVQEPALVGGFEPAAAQLKPAEGFEVDGADIEASLEGPGLFV